MKILERLISSCVCMFLVPTLRITKTFRVRFTGDRGGSVNRFKFLHHLVGPHYRDVYP